MTPSRQSSEQARSSSSQSPPEALPVLVDRLRWDRRRHPYSGRREYAQAARQITAMAKQILTAGDVDAQRALVPVLRTAVDRVTRALQYLDDSSGVIGQHLDELLQTYARACCAAPPSPAPLAAWLVGLVWDGPGWPQIRLADFAPALGPKGLSRIADLVTERSARGAGRVTGPATGAHLDPDRWHEQWAAQHLREQLAQLTGDVDSYVAVLAENLRHADRYRIIAAVLQDAGRLTEAIDWARRGLAERPGDPHRDRLRDLLVDLRIGVGDPDAAVQERRSDFQRCPTASAYQALHATAIRVGLDPDPVTAWALDILRARVAQDPRFAPHLVTVLLAHRQDEAWSVALSHPDQLGEPQLVELLALRAATHAEDVIQPYRDLIEQHIKLMTPLRAAHQAPPAASARRARRRARTG